MGKLTREMADEIAGLVRVGNFQVAAAAKVGVAESTLIRWMHRGEAHAKSSNPERSGSVYAHLWRATTAAEGEAETEAVGILKVAAALDPRSLQFFLTRRWAARWGRHDNLALTGADGGPVKVEGVQDRILEKLAALVPPATPTDPAAGG